MQKPDLDEYLHLTIGALPNTANAAARLSEVVSTLQTAQAALRDDPGRADAALTFALSIVKGLHDEFAKAAEWVRSTTGGS